MRIILEHQSGSRAGGVDTFDGDVVSVGRDPSNDLTYDPVQDIRCSTFHAEIRVEGGQVWLKDLGSTNGTYVNDERITEAELTSGDEVSFGYQGPRAVVRWESAEGVAPALPGMSVSLPGATMAERSAESGTIATSTPGPPAEAEAAEPAPKAITLEHLSGIKGGTAESFKGGVVTAGRNPDCDLVFDSEKELSVSWRHGRFVWEDGVWFYEDLNSRNGSYVDGMRHARCPLRSGAEVRFGVTGPAVRVSFASAAAAELGGRTIEFQVVGSDKAEEQQIPAVPLDLLPPDGKITIGRADGMDLRLDHPSVSRQHAAIARRQDGFVIEDAGSTNGVYVNGERITEPRLLSMGDRIHVGLYVMTFLGNRLETLDQEGNIRVEADTATLTVVGRDRESGRRGPVRILDNVSLVVEPREFVAILGPSGAGKSTLMNVLSGRLMPTEGSVFYNEDDFFLNLDSYRPTIGYVPQRDIVHYQLTVDAALRYAVALRLPNDTDTRETYAHVEETLEQIRLRDRKYTRVGALSGGQIKRVNLGMELVSRPNVLFLDEATSGLDALTDLRMMSLFRRIANQGRTVICITHNVEYIADQCSLVALLTPGGKLGFYGPPADMLSHFRVNRVCQVYDKLEKEAPEYWEKEYQDTRWHAEYVEKRADKRKRRIELPNTQREQRTIAGTRVVSNTRPRTLWSSWRQFATLTKRYVSVLSRDTSNLLLLLGQAPLIALIVGAVLMAPGEGLTAAEIVAHQSKVAFFLALVAAWFGCSNAAREIVKEDNIYRRERAFNLSIPAYVFSKAAPLAVLCCLQCAALLYIVRPMAGLLGPPLPQLGALAATAVTAMLMGMLISAFARTEDRAISLVPLVLIPQVVLADAIVRLEGPALLGARFLVITYWSFDALKATLAGAVVPAKGGEVLMRHVVRPGLDGDPAALLGRIGLYWQDLAVLGVFAVAFFLLTVIRMKAKDAQNS